MDIVETFPRLHATLTKAAGDMKGTGLGPAICKQFATRMGGALSFVSPLGKGSTFTLELRDVKYVEHSPDEDSTVDAGQDIKKDAGQAQSGGQAVMVKKSMRNCHMLIVDDVPLNLAVLKALLTRLGLLDIVTAVDGQDAWEKNQASDKPFDLVLTDMWMPKMNDKDLVAKIKSARTLTLRRTSRLCRHSRYRGTEDVQETRIHGDSPEAVDHRQTVRVVQLKDQNNVSME